MTRTLQKCNREHIAFSKFSGVTHPRTPRYAVTRGAPKRTPAPERHEPPLRHCFKLLPSYSIQKFENFTSKAICRGH